MFGLTRSSAGSPATNAGKKPLLYRLNTLATAAEMFVVNGEKAADRGAAELGIAATCTPDGEGKWLGEFTKALIGKAIRIVIDRDEKGERHGKVVSEALAPHVAEVKIVRLPGLPPKGDLYDWIEAGGTRQQLDEIVANTPVVELPPPVISAPEPQALPGRRVRPSQATPQRYRQRRPPDPEVRGPPPLLPGISQVARVGWSPLGGR